MPTFFRAIILNSFKDEPYRVVCLAQEKDALKLFLRTLSDNTCINNPDFQEPQ